MSSQPLVGSLLLLDTLIRLLLDLLSGFGWWWRKLSLELLELDDLLSEGLLGRLERSNSVSESRDLSDKVGRRSGSGHEAKDGSTADEGTKKWEAGKEKGGTQGHPGVVG